jgi:hypothetical protein
MNANVNNGKKYPHSGEMGKCSLHKFGAFIGPLAYDKRDDDKKVYCTIGSRVRTSDIMFIVANFYMRLFCTLQEKRKAKFAEHFCATPF